MKIMHNPVDLGKLISKLKAEGKKIGLCHGVFDLIHPGHIQHFIAAKKQVDLLIVSITSEEYVNKGPGRPIFNNEIRSISLSAFESIDFVTISNYPSSTEIIKILKPDIYFKGSEYLDSSDDPTGRIKLEKKAIEEIGGEIRFTEEITFSSSNLINQHMSYLDQKIEKWLSDFRKDFDFNSIDKHLLAISNLDVSIIGEIILDQYTFVNALAKSSKDPILAFTIKDTSIFPGGILAIANNCAEWVKNVSVYSTRHHEDHSLGEVLPLVNEKINFNFVNSNNRTILKHRYIDDGTFTKVFETYNYEPEFVQNDESQNFIEALSGIKNSDLTLVADYGHGLISADIIDAITQNSNYLALNTQTNAGNRGYNNLSRYPRADFFTANSGELQLELRSKNLNYNLEVPKLMEKLNTKYSVLTLGSDGLLVFDHSNHTKVPALATNVKDKVGAGDSVFAIASLLMFVGAPIQVVGFISNLVAAHEVAQFGHRKSLSMGDLKKQIKSMLK